MRSCHPGIFQIGTVTDDGTTVVVSGWGLSLCAGRCSCHRHPDTGQLAIDEDQPAGLLGLVQHRPCGCCTPWAADELAAVLRDLTSAAGLQAADPRG